MFDRVPNTPLFPLVNSKIRIMIAEVCPFINTPLISEKYKGYNLTVRGSTSAGLGDPAEQNNVFTSEESK